MAKRATGGVPGELDKETRLAIVASGGEVDGAYSHVTFDLVDKGEEKTEPKPEVTEREAAEKILDITQRLVRFYALHPDDNVGEWPAEDRQEWFRLRRELIGQCQWPLGENAEQEIAERPAWPRGCKVRVRAQMEGSDQTMIRFLAKQAAERHGIEQSDANMALAGAAAFCAVMAVEVVKPKTLRWPRIDGKPVLCAPYDLSPANIEMDAIVDSWMEQPRPFTMWVGGEIAEMAKDPFGLHPTMKRT